MHTTIITSLQSWVVRLCRVLPVLLMIPVADAGVIHATLNDLTIGLDEDTGNIVSLESPHTGLMLTAAPDSAGLLDVAYPVESFAAMRLASRFSRARVTTRKNKVTIRWERLGASRLNLALPSGTVTAEVTLEAAGDGRSVIARARIENNSEVPVPQILFPDLWGLKPFASVENTRLRLARGVVTPFNEPMKEEGTAPFYARPVGAHNRSSSSLSWTQYEAGEMTTERKNVLRWLDFGGYRGGISVFQKKWGSYDWPNVLTRRTERDPNSLRMVWEHEYTVEPGQGWDSGEFWLTPHAGGWAKGIEVYREYVRKMNPPRPIPDHVREDIGYQTIWMIQTVEVNPDKAFFHFEDLPRVAADAKRYGIHEIVPWGWNVYSTMPIPVREELGTIEDLVEAVEISRQMGVNIAPFISLLTVRNQYAERYGREPNNDDWTYHYELIPQFTPYYTDFWNGVKINSNNKIWLRDVEDALAQWIDRGITSFSWDQFEVHETADGSEPELPALIERIRERARAERPQSTFSGETNTHLEVDGAVLDYLWHWNDYKDEGPITNVIKVPRMNCNVEESALVVAKCFADNLYINAMPRKPDAPNGTALISDEPELAGALLHASRLRKQFLPYFVEGVFIGDSILSQPVDAFVRGYQLDDRLLVIVLNDTDTVQAVGVQSDLDLWLPKTKEAYLVTAYDNGGQALSVSEVSGSQWFSSTLRLEPGRMAFFEVQLK